MSSLAVGGSPVLSLGELVNLRQARATRVIGFMRNLDLDHLILCGHDQIRYATDYRSLLVSEANDWCALVFSRDGQGVMLVPDVDCERAPDGDDPASMRLVPVPSWAPMALHPDLWILRLVAEIRLGGGRRVGFDRLPWTVLEGLKSQLPNVAFVAVEKEMFELRSVKDALEIRLLEAAARLNISAIHEALSAASPGDTDAKILGQVAAKQLAAGAEAFTHSMCNVRGSESWFPRSQKVGPRGAFFVDVGCYGPGGYASDLTRTCFVGEPDDAVLRAYQVLLGALQVGQAAAHAGSKVSTIDSEVNRYLVGHGLPGTPYAMGHGVGLRSCEVPTIYRTNLMDRDLILESGNVISLEPETRVSTPAGTYVLKVEDNFEVGPGGARPFIPAAYDEPVLVLGR